MFEVQWVELKQLLDVKSMTTQFVESASSYLILGIDGNLIVHCKLPNATTPDPQSDQYDFEQNYKAAGNSVISPVDAGNRPLARTAITNPGWILDVRAVQVTTATLNGVDSKKHDLTDWGDIALSFFKDDGGGGLALMVNPTQPELDADCIRTVMDWEPLFHYDILGGQMEIMTLPAGFAKDAYLTCLGIPFLSGAQGGSIEMLGRKRVAYETQVMTLDGKTPKTLFYDATYHTNEIRSIVDHKAGDRIELEVAIDHYWDRSNA